MNTPVKLGEEQKGACFGAHRLAWKTGVDALSIEISRRVSQK